MVTVTVTNQTNPPPIVSITTNGTIFTAPASIIINATATDNTSISKVEFYQGALRINTDTSFPYSFTWTNVQAGSYVITARAYDSQNASSVSSPINVTVTTAVTIIPVSRTNILPLTRQLEFIGNDTPPTRVTVPY